MHFVIFFIFKPILYEETVIVEFYKTINFIQLYTFMLSYLIINTAILLVFILLINFSHLYLFDVQSLIHIVMHICTLRHFNTVVYFYTKVWDNYCTLSLLSDICTILYFCNFLLFFFLSMLYNIIRLFRF